MAAIVKALRPSGLIFFYIIIIFLICSPIASSNPDSEALLQLKKSFTNAQALDSWQPGSDPCGVGKQWAGLVCENGMVTGLRLVKMGLSGKIDADALRKIPNLRSLTITNNSFAGPIPELRKMGAIRGVYLSANQFSGVIPPDFFKDMASLRKLWLNDNQFTGLIPLSLAQISHLISLHLGNNQFSGPIPDFQQRTLDTLDLSNNNLQGEIPAGLSKFNASSFAGNDGLCGNQLVKPCNLQEESGTDYSLAYGLMGLSVLILVLMAIGIFVLRRKQEKRDGFVKENLDESMGSVGWSSTSKKDMDRSASTRKSLSASRRAGSNRGGGGRGIGDLVVVNDEKGVFGLADLMKAAAEVLGNGSLGSSYKAMLSNGFVVVVKRIKETNKMGKEGFEAEINRMAVLRHLNILTPVAYHYRKEEKLLVYEYIPKGNLLYVLHGDRGPSHTELNWPARLKIIKGIARGLDYLHTEYADSDLPHGNLKSSNVLVASNYEPLLADFGLSSLLSNNQAAQVLFAYKSPEVAQRGQVSPKCDVYCLGILILEVITGKFLSQYINSGNEGTNVVEMMKSTLGEGRTLELLDPEITNAKNALGQMQRLLQIGVACAESSLVQRLGVKEAARRIEEIQIEGPKDDDKLFNAVPTLKDGYTDTTTAALHSNGPPSRNNVQNVNDQQVSGSSQDGSHGDQIVRQNNDSFAFHIS